MPRLMKQHRSLGEIVEKYREVRKMTEDLQGAKDLADMADDDEMREMAALEIAEIEAKLPAAEEELKTTAPAQRSERRKERHPRDPCRNRR